MSSRERRLAMAATAVVLLAAAWAWIWQPMQEDMMRLRRDIPRDRAALATARAQIEEIAGLQREKPPAIGGRTDFDPRVAVERVLGERGLKAAVTSLEVKDNRAYVTFAAVSFDALVGALDTLAKTDGLRPVEVTLTSRVDPGTVRAEITLAR
jgi:type II secretory pathway component PulM